MIFEERIEYKPFEYPEVLKFCEKLQQTYWVHTEVNFDADMQQFKTALNPMQRATILRSLRAISQVEVAVKTFWGKLYNYLPKPEFNGLGATFAESEFRHSEAYSRLLDVLGVQDFAEFLKIPVIKDRYSKITSVTKFKVHTPEEFCRTLAQFSLFIENASLFSQFASIMYFQKFHGLMKNVSNQIHWTSRDENVHALAGMYIIKVMQNELGFQPDLKKDAQDFYEIESRVIDYIFQDGDFDHLTAEQMKSFVRFRINDSFKHLDMPLPLEEGKSLIWFDELLGDVSKDFFDTRPTSYTKHEVSFSADQLF